MAGMDMLNGLLQFGGQAAGNIGTSFGGLLSLLLNQHNMGVAGDALNHFYQPGQTGPNGEVLYGAGPSADYRNTLQNAATQYGPGGMLDTEYANQRIQGDANQLYSRGMGYLQGQGAQERKDINTQFNNFGASTQADLTSRGLAGTTALPGMAGLVERQRSDALGGLNERLNSQYLNTDAALSQNRTNAYLQGYGLRQSGLQNQLGLAQGVHNTFFDELVSRLNLLTGQQIPYPSQNNNINLASASGGASWPAPNIPSQSSGSAFGMGAASSGIGTLGTLGTFGLLGGFK